MICFRASVPSSLRPRAEYGFGWLMDAIGVSWKAENPDEHRPDWLFCYGDMPDRSTVGEITAMGGLVIWMHADTDILAGNFSSPREPAASLLGDNASLRIPYWGTTALSAEGENWNITDVPNLVASEHIETGLFCKIGVDLIAVSFWALSRSEELEENFPCDEHGRAKSAAMFLVRVGDHNSPVLDRYADWLCELFDICFQRLERPWARLNRWPADYNAVALYSHDLDVLNKWTPKRIADELYGSLTSKKKPLLSVVKEILSPNDPYMTITKTCEAEKKAGALATWFISAGRQNSLDPSYAANNPLLHNAISRIMASGSEIGLHASYDWMISADGMRHGKKIIEGMAGEKISGNRSHYLRFAADGAWRALSEAGFEYDATLGFSDDVGFRAWTSLPFEPYDTGSEGPLDIVEIPIAIMDVALLWRVAQDGDSARAITRALWDATSRGGIVSTLFHHNCYDSGEFAYLGNWFEESLQWSHRENRWQPTHSELVRWWHGRNSTVLESGDDYSTVRIKRKKIAEHITVTVGGGGKTPMQIEHEDGVLKIMPGKSETLMPTRATTVLRKTAVEHVHEKKKKMMVVFNDLHHDARVFKEATTITEAGYDLLVLGIQTDSRPLSGWESIAVQRIKLPENAGLRLRYGVWWRRAYTELMRRRPTLIHAHDLDSLLPAVMAANRLHVPLIYDSHELWTELPTLTDRPVVRMVWKLMERALITHATSIIAVSDGIASELVARYAVRKPIVLRNMPHLNKMKKNTGTENPLRELSKCPPNTPLVLFQGGLLVGLGIEVAIDAVGLLKRGRLAILGDGPLRDELRRYTEKSSQHDRVSFCGAVPFAELPNLTSGADVGLYLARSTGLNIVHSLPNKLFEYIHAGVPVVVRDYPETAQTVRHFDVGVVVPINASANEIAAAIERVLEHRNRLSANCIEAAKKLRWNIDAEKLLQTYKELT